MRTRFMSSAACTLALLVGCTELDQTKDQDVQDEDDDIGDPTLPPVNLCNVPEAHGRAYGLAAGLLGFPLIPATPDSAGTNPGIGNGIDLDTLGLGLPLGGGVLRVSHKTAVAANASQAEATSEIVGLTLGLPGLGITAGVIRSAASAAYSQIGTATSARDSGVIGLKINGTTYPNYDLPATIPITEPITNRPLAEVRILETIREQSTPTQADVQINALHIIVHDIELTPFIDESTEIILGHSEASVSFEACLQ